jgi:hypothetical protein
MTKDMTNGSPMKLILGFSVPLLFGFLFQQFYNLMDTLIVGRFLGVDDLAAVGSTGSVNFLIIGFCMGVCNGFAIPLAHKFGAGDYKGMRGFMMNAIYLSAIFAVVMTIMTVIFCMPILELMRTPENIIDGAYQYIVIIFWGIPVTYLYNLVSGIIRSMGDSKTPVVFLVIAAVINIGLDLFFIVVLGTGVEGAAWATVISQLISGIGCLIYSIKHFEILRPSREEMQINKTYMMTLSGISFPVTIFINVDFPSPLAPTNPMCSPFKSRKDTSLKIALSPNPCVRCSTFKILILNPFVFNYIVQFFTICSTLVGSFAVIFYLYNIFFVFFRTWKYAGNKNASAKIHATGLAKHAAT